jgi:predicted  nucleic acid-binding Zn-ribbon protein
MFNRTQREQEADKKLAALAEQVEQLTKAVAGISERCAALEAQHEADTESLEDMQQTLKSLSKRVDWEAEQVHRTATALMQQIRHSATIGRD